MFEGALVIEQEKLTLLLDLAKLKWDAYDDSTSVLKSLGCVIDDYSHNNYKTLASIMAIRQRKRELPLLGASNSIKDILPSLRMLLANASKSIDDGLAEAVVLFALNVNTKTLYKYLAAQYAQPRELVESLFIGLEPPYTL